MKSKAQKGCGKINVIRGISCGETKWGKIHLCPECSGGNDEK